MEESGLLNKVKQDIFLLTWNEKPDDLDSRVLTPNDEIVGIAVEGESEKKSNLYANMSTDSRAGHGPEVIAVKKWLNTNEDAKDKIGGHYEFYVYWRG